MRRPRISLPLLVLGLLVAGCGSDKMSGGPPPEEAISADTLLARIATFQLGPLPATPYPRTNTQQAARIKLGKLLFFDPILGGESAPWVKSAAGKDPYRYRASDVACATCHQPQLGFSDDRPIAAGVGGGHEESHTVGPDRVAPSQSIVTGVRVDLVPRNSMTILNTGLNGRNSIESTASSFQFMDGRVVNGLESQVFAPIFNREEMAGDAYGRPGIGDNLNVLMVADSVRNRIVAIPDYFNLFKAAFPLEIVWPESIRPDMVALAIAAYERELNTPNSRYDRFVTGHLDALTSQEKRGFMLFCDKGRCASCHRGPMLSDYTFRCQGVGDAYDRILPGFAGKNGQGGDWGRYHGVKADVPDSDLTKFQFRVVSLRNVEKSPPYFHSGSARTLREAVEFYNRGGLGPQDIPDQVLTEARATRDPAIRPLGLTTDEIDALIAFMKTTTAAAAPGPDGDDLTAPPQRVPSGLLPPGVPTPAGPGPFRLPPR